MTGSTRNSVAMANHLLDARSPVAAMRILGAHLAAHPEDPGALETLARALGQLDRHAESITVAEQAIAIAPDRAYAWHVISVAATNVGRHSKAVHAAITARGLEPHHAPYHAYVAIAVAHSGAATGKTVREAKEAIELAPDAALGYYALGQVWTSLGRHRKAEHAFRDALRVEPSDSDVLHDLAVVQFQRGKLGTSVSALVDVLSANPTHEPARQNFRGFADRVLLIILVALWLYVSGLDLVDYLSTTDGPEAASASHGLEYPSPVTRVGLAIGLTVAILALLLWFRAGVGRRFRSVVMSMYGHDWLQRIWTGLLAAAYLLAVATTLAGPSLSALFYNLAILVLVSASVLRLFLTALIR